MSPLDAAEQALRIFMQGSSYAMSVCCAAHGQLWEAHGLLWEEGFPVRLAKKATLASPIAQPDLTYRGAAVFSADRRRRLLLARSWVPGPVMMFCMLNPSKAGAHVDDNTIRRCVGFAKRERCGGIVVVNTRALIATNPKDLDGYVDLPINGTFIEAALRCAASADPRGPEPVVAAWGSNIDRDDTLAMNFLSSAKGHGLEVLCFGTCANGTPKHPLRLAKDTPLVRCGAQV